MTKGRQELAFVRGSDQDHRMVGELVEILTELIVGACLVVLLLSVVLSYLLFKLIAGKR